jgi:tRNA (guanine-N(7)-)-methyltransferase subunit TRM82
MESACSCLIRDIHTDYQLRFVSSIHLLRFAQSVLVSGGGDPDLRFWDWLSGRQTGSLSVFNSVQPYLNVRASKRKRPLFEENAPAKPHGRKGRAKAKAEKAEPEAVMRDEMDTTGGTQTPSVDGNEPVAASEPIASTVDDIEVFAVQRIDSISEPSPTLVFSAIGYDSSGIVG